MKRFIIYVALISILGLVFSCAQVVMPSGGPKDTSPPKPIKSYPEWGSTNFEDQKVVIQFNEFVELDNPTQKISISPFYKGAVKTKISGKNVFLFFDEKLKNDKTYLISFNKAIKDFKADNFLNYYEHRFSTGAKIDSGHLKISHLFSENGKTVENATVVLVPSHRDFDSSSFLYNTTTAEGVSKMHNLDSNLYFPFGFLDSNFNKKWDKNEYIAFYNNKVSFLDTNVILNYFKEKPDSISFEVKLQSPNLIYVAFNYEADQIKLEKGNVYSLIKKSKNSFFVFSNQLFGDSIVLFLDDNKHTLSVPKYKKTDLFSVGLLAENKSDKRTSEIKINDTLTLFFNSKISKIIDSNIIFTFDTIKDKNVKSIFSNHKIQFYNFTKNKSYKTVFLKNAIFSDSFKNDSFIYSFSTLSDSFIYDSITIHFKFKDSSANYFYKVNELNNNEFIKIKHNESVLLNKIIFPSLQFQLFKDENNDGYREKGSYKNRRIPEKSIFKEITLEKNKKTYTIEF